MNSVNLIGRLTDRVDITVTNAGKKVANFTLAVFDRKDKDGKEITYFPNCAAWEGTAELLEVFTERGSQIGVSGKLTTRKYDDKDGRKVYVTEVLVDRIDLPAKQKDNARETQKAHVPQQQPSNGYYPDEPGNNEDLPF